MNIDKESDDLCTTPLTVHKVVIHRLGYVKNLSTIAGIRNPQF
ncbi:hypothetical protein [Sporosarcina ureae]|nr:hypothetical protein [Sporosarcina ureae]